MAGLLGPIVALVATTQPEVAERFYADTLGLKCISRDPYAVVFDHDGTMLRVAIVEHLQPQPFTVLGWQVANIEAAVSELANKGVTFTRYEFIPQDELGIWSTPDGAKVAWFKDPDGNTLSLTQFVEDRDAARRGQDRTRQGLPEEG